MAALCNRAKYFQIQPQSSACLWLFGVWIFRARASPAFGEQATLEFAIRRNRPIGLVFLKEFPERTNRYAVLSAP
jgi:hypothetical protein